MLIKNAKIIYMDRIEDGSVRIAGNKITELNPQDDNDAVVIDAHGLYLSPGFIDIHIHGAAGKDTMEGSRDSLTAIAKAIARHGTTSFVPTTMTMDIPSIRKAISAAADAKENGTGAANVLGVHLEGPFINADMMRAQNPKYVLMPSIEAFQQMTGEFESDVIFVTLAPEMPGCDSLIRYLCTKGIKVSMGHTKADYSTAMSAVADGVSHVTHLFNAMPPLHHRVPGVIGAALESEITAEMIADGIHIDYPALRIAIRQKGIDHMILITDAMMGCTMPEGKYTLGGQEVYLSGGTAKLKDGTFAGTLLTLDEAVRNLKNNTEYPLNELVRMASYNPAQFCGCENHKGKIEIGYDADLLLYDEDISIKKIIIGGEILD